MDPFMVFWIFLIGVTAGVILGVVLTHRVAVYPLHREIERLTTVEPFSSRRVPEKYISFMERYPFSKENLRFIGEPVDAIQFEEDKILFVEFKKPMHKNVRRLVEEKKVACFTMK
jgi:hypothetical protein